MAKGDIYIIYNEVCQKSAAYSTAVPVGADRIRPQSCATERLGEWNQRPVAVLGFPRGEAVAFSGFSEPMKVTDETNYEKSSPNL